MKYSALLKRTERAIKKIEGMQQKPQLHIVAENEPFEHLSGLVIIMSGLDDSDEQSLPDTVH